MSIWKKIPLLGKILIGIALGIATGLLLGHVGGAADQVNAAGVIDDSSTGGAAYALRWIATAGTLLGGLLSFCIPIILIGFIASGISELGNKAGKTLGLTVGVAYLSTILGGLFAFVVGKLTLETILDSVATTEFTLGSISPIFELEIAPIMGSITALILAFILGVVGSKDQNSTLGKLLVDFKKVADFTIRKIIIPILPLRIFTVFVGMSFTDGLGDVMKVFGIVYAIILVLHWTMIVVHHTISSTLAKTNPFVSIRKMLPAYFTAVGTQSSAVTLPVTLECAEDMGIEKDVRDFAVPLCANVHLPGSMITITMCTLAVAIIMNIDVTLGTYLPFLFTLGIAMVAAPGVPGGAIMVAAGFLVSMLGFGEAASALMIALYLAQDSFGTAANVTTDTSVARIVEVLENK